MVILGANMKAIRELAKQSTIEENLTMDIKSGVKNEMKNKRGMYVYPMTIRRKKKKDGNAMEIGSAEVKGRFESDNVLEDSKRMTQRTRTKAHGEVFEG